MSNDALSAATTAALLKELKEQRAKHATAAAMIGKIEALLGVGASKPKPPRGLATSGPGDAAAWMLRQKDIPMTNRQIVDALTAIGYKKIKSTEHIGAALHHRAKKTKDVRREDNHWIYVGTESAADATQFNGAAEDA